MKRETAVALLFGMLSLPAPAAQTYFHGGDGQLSVGWQDREGKTEQISYALAAGKLPPLIAFRPASMEEDILQHLLQQAGTEFPKVQFALSHPALTLTLQSRDPAQERAAMAWLKQQHTKLEDSWLKQHYFQRFTPADGMPAIKQDHVRIALASKSELASLVDQLKQAGATDTEARQKTVAYILDFIQNIPYQQLDSASGRSGKGFLSPRQVLEQNRGDCDSKVTLMAAMLAQLFPDLPQAMVFIPGHALLGVALPARDQDATLSWQGETYLLMEPTGPGQFAMGEIAPTSKTLVDSKQWRLQQVQTRD